MKKFIKALGVFLFLIFCFLVFVSFNLESSSVILNGMAVGSEFYQKTQNAMVFLMLFLIFTPLQIFVVYLLLKSNKVDALKKFVFFSLIMSIACSLMVYYFSGVFPFRIPTVN
ncbi:hypothetical protein [Undibacterium sp. Tian12W]|uniref:hypothetical protein n=1 Tax=Undibacterium sp. Tian12W TaxID=3413054 RepID=UPI003BF1A383